MTEADLHFATRWSVVAALAGAGGVLVVLAAGQPPGGRLLLGVTAAVLLGEALRGALLRPTLTLTATGVEVVRGLRRTAHRWSEIQRVGTLAPRGAAPRRRAAALELDLGDTLVVVPAYRLGRPLADVVSALERRRPTPSR